MPVDLLERNLIHAAEAVAGADAVLITAGAGMGVDSGLPDFRGREGFWKAYPPIAKMGMDFADMANPHWFAHEPDFAWAFYGHRLDLYRKTEPHSGFARLLALGESKPGGYYVFTSNVDGQFQKAGFSENRIEECHGSIHYLQCTKPCAHETWPADAVKLDIDMDRFRATSPLPRCPHCREVARPNIMLFGDWTWIGTRYNTQSRRMHRWLEGLERARHSLVVLEFGAGKAVPTVRRTSEAAARGARGVLVRVNPRDHDVPKGPHVSIPLGSAEAMERIIELLD